ncbi:hypothetical protein BH09BAC3_BH09BAC3_08850 [soil metagenome]
MAACCYAVVILSDTRKFSIAIRGKNYPVVVVIVFHQHDKSFCNGLHRRFYEFRKISICLPSTSFLPKPHSQNFIATNNLKRTLYRTWLKFPAKVVSNDTQ